MNDNGQTDPELDKVYNKITAVIQEHPEVGGFIALHNRKGGQFQTFFPAWTTATFRPKGEDGMALHFKVDVDPDSVDNQDTVAMLFGLRDTTLRASAIFERVATALAKHTGIDLVAMLAPKEPTRPGNGQEPH